MRACRPRRVSFAAVPVGGPIPAAAWSQTPSTGTRRPTACCGRMGFALPYSSDAFQRLAVSAVGNFRTTKRRAPAPLQHLVFPAPD